MTLRPLPGDAETAARLARTLAAEGESLRALGSTLRALGGPGVVWHGAAGDAFRVRAGAVAGALERLSRRYAVASVAVGRLAVELGHCQAEALVAQRLHEEWQGVTTTAGDAMAVAETSPDPAVQASAARHRERMVEALERTRAAQVRYDQAWQEFHRADRACATVLRGLLDDGLADSWQYDALVGTSELAGSVCTVAGLVGFVPPLRPAATVVSTAASVLGLASDVAVKVAWGDGSWRSIGATAAAGALGQGGGLLRKGAQYTNAERVAAAGTRAERRALRLGPGERVRRALAEKVRDPLADARPKPRSTYVPKPSPRGLALKGAWAVETVRARAHAVAREKLLDDLRLVTSRPGTSLPMFATGVGAQAGAKVLDVESGVGDAVDGVRDRRRQAETGRRLKGSPR